MERLIVLMSFFLFISCTEQSSSTNDESKRSPNPISGDAPFQASCFNEVGPNPILESGDEFNNSHWNDPSLLKQGEQYIMYASSPLESDQNKIGIYRLVSNDGVTFNRSPSTPVLSNLNQDWASKGVETPSVVLFKGLYHMFFTGYKTNTHSDFRIGHATSSDGISWNITNNFILGPTGTITDFNGASTAEPGAVVFNNKIFLYFSAIGYHQDINDQDNTQGSIVQTIGLVSSEDGFNWSAPQNILRPNQKLYPRSALGKNKYYGLSTPQPIIHDNKIILFFDIINEDPSWHQESISYAYSSNGITNFKQHTETIHEKSDFWWTNNEIRSPFPIIDDNKLKLYFAGHVTSSSDYTLGIGLSECDL